VPWVGYTASGLTLRKCKGSRQRGHATLQPALMAPELAGVDTCVLQQPGADDRTVYVGLETVLLAPVAVKREIVLLRVHACNSNS
jgi:hypothetical protein